MNRFRGWAAVVLLMLSAATAFAANISGAWSGDVKTPNGDVFPLSFTFKQDGTTLTGTVTGPQGDPTPISDGKVVDDKVSFSVSYNGMTIKHEGVATADEIKLTSKVDQADATPAELTLKRAK
ncbi:MAG TPA: hypothetical protein VGD62_12320 [Acidobacteriaceae bacterium]